MGADYHSIVNNIIRLPWKNLSTTDLGQLMFVSLATAQEFAESLGIALQLYPQDSLLKSMAAGELQTNNLRFENWERAGDHWEFLKHFLAGSAAPAETAAACKAYKKTVRSLNPQIRAMSIFSREDKLPHVFSQILAAPVWENTLPQHLQALHFYLLKHIELDSKTGGHRDMVSHFPITDKVTPFYQARLQLYLQAIQTLGKQ